MTDKTIAAFAFNDESLEQPAEVRTLTDEHGEPWFVLRDVLNAMGSSTRPAIAKDSIINGLGRGYTMDTPLQTAGGTQQVTIISEPAVTFLVSRSNTERGRKLNRWIHGEVLPQIRKTGQYAQPKDPWDAIVDMAIQGRDNARRIRALEDQQADTAAQLRALVDGEGFYTVVGYANKIGIRIDEHEASRLGKAASHYCRLHAIHRGQAPHPRYGKTWTYPAEVLELIFASEGRDAA